MSGKAMVWVAKNSPVEGRDHLVLMALAYFAPPDPTNGAWECWPSIDRITEIAHAGCRSTVVRSLAALRLRGVIQSITNGKQQRFGKQVRSTNIYRIMLKATMPNGEGGMPNPGPGMPTVAYNVSEECVRDTTESECVVTGAVDGEITPTPPPLPAAVNPQQERARTFLDHFCRGAERFPMGAAERQRFLAGAQRLAMEPGLTPTGVFYAAQRLRNARSYDEAVTPIKLFASLGAFYKKKDDLYRDHCGDWRPEYETSRKVFPSPPGYEDWAERNRILNEKAKAEGTTYMQLGQKALAESISR